MVGMTKRLTEEVKEKDKGKMKGGQVVNAHAVDCQIRKANLLYQIFY